MSFFENLKILLKKHYINTYSASACGGLRPCRSLHNALIFIWGRGHVQTIMQRICKSPKDRPKDRPKSWEAVFANSWM